MKKVLLALLCFSVYLSSFAQIFDTQCDGWIQLRNYDDNYFQFSYYTTTLRDGTREEPVIPDSSYYSEYLFEILHPDGSVLRTSIQNHEEDGSYTGLHYEYRFSFIDHDCSIPNIEDSPGISARVTLIHHFPVLYYETWDYASLGVTLDCESPFQTANCDGDGGGDGGDDEEPNLTWGNVTVKVGTTTYNVNNGQTPILKKNTSAEFNITVANNDDGNSGSFPCLLLVSENNNAYPNPNSWPVYNYLTANFSGITANNSTNGYNY